MRKERAKTYRTLWWLQRAFVPFLLTVALPACAPDSGEQSAQAALTVGSEGEIEDSGTIDASHRTLMTIYVPVYSHISSRDSKRTIDLTATLSVRNTDPKEKITIVAARYYNSDGELIRNFVESPRSIRPMASAEFLVEEVDKSGGSGANFIVELAASYKTMEPVVEAVMIGTSSAQGISFTSTGRLLKKEEREE